MLSQLLRRFLARSGRMPKNSWSPLANRQDDSLDVCLFCLFVFIYCRFVDTYPLFFSCTVAYKQPLLYNLAVTREVIKQIYIREGLQPPSLFTIRTTYASLWSQITSPGQVRNLVQNAEVGRLGVYGLQAYGIFKVRFISYCSTTSSMKVTFGNSRLEKY